MVQILIWRISHIFYIHGYVGAQSNPAADARKDEEIRSLQDQLEKMRLDNANKDSAIEKLVSNIKIKMFKARLRDFSNLKVD